MIIALDGPAASGKGTLARRLARHFDLPHLDTGLLYRATAKALIDQGHNLADRAAAIAAARGLALTEFDEDSLRGREVGAGASIVGAIPEVRAALFEIQRSFAQRPGGAVLDGRDIGTVICPEAPVTIFVTANPETRATDIRKRDALDATRPVAPLKAAEDAYILDTSMLDIDAAFAEALAIAAAYAKAG
jgi:cytidylate kinase